MDIKTGKHLDCELNISPEAKRELKRRLELFNRRNGFTRPCQPHEMDRSGTGGGPWGSRPWRGQQRNRKSGVGLQLVWRGPLDGDQAAARHHDLRAGQGCAGCCQHYWCWCTYGDAASKNGMLARAALPPFYIAHPTKLPIAISEAWWEGKVDGGDGWPGACDRDVVRLVEYSDRWGHGSGGVRGYKVERVSDDVEFIVEPEFLQVDACAGLKAECGTCEDCAWFAMNYPCKTCGYFGCAAAACIACQTQVLCPMPS